MAALIACSLFPLLTHNLAIEPVKLEHTTGAEAATL
jgi:hypothetical protein